MNRKEKELLLAIEKRLHNAEVAIVGIASLVNESGAITDDRVSNAIKTMMEDYIYSSRKYGAEWDSLFCDC